MRRHIVAPLALVAFLVAAPHAPGATVLPGVSSGSLTLHLSADTNVTTAGSAVTHWVDPVSGADFRPLIGTSPTLVANAMNGQPVIRFNGAGNSLQAVWSPTGLGDDFTLFIVTQNATNPVGAFESHPGGANTARFYVNNEFELWSNNPDAPVTLHADGSVVAVRADASPTRSLNIVELSHSGTVTTSDSSVSTTAISWVNPAIGEIYNNVAFFAGDIAEIIIYDTALSDADRDAVLIALAQTYGIPAPAALPAGLVLLATMGLRRRHRD